MIEVGLVGPGRVGRTLATLLPRERFHLGPVLSHTLTSARRSVRLMEIGEPTEDPETFGDCDLLLITVRDHVIEAVAKRFATTGFRCAKKVVLHTTGLLSILEHVRPKNPDAMRRIHVARGFFLSRRVPAATGETEYNKMIAMRKSLEAEGVEFSEYSEPTEILPDVWVTGPVERRHAEKNYPREVQVKLDGEWVEDYVPESQALTVVTDKGPIVVLGCGHSGTVNVLELVQASIQDQPIHALMGGMHLYAADDQTLGWTADRLRDLGLQHLMAGHCTGVEPLVRLRTGLNLNRRTAVVGAVGSRFVYGEGIHPTDIAR